MNDKQAYENHKRFLKLAMAMACERQSEFRDTSEWTVHKWDGFCVHTNAELSADSVIATGFLARAEAEAYIRDFNTPTAVAERVARERKFYEGQLADHERHKTMTTEEVMREFWCGPPL